MYPYISVLGVRIPTYTLFVALGMLILSIVMSHLLFKKRLINKYINIIIISSIGLLIGARCFGIISRCIGIFCETGVLDIQKAINNSGLVFYGGLLGCLGTMKVLCLARGKEFGKITDIVAVCIPLFHLFGRMGCFFGGCCYGIKSSSIFAIPYRVTMESEWENRLPVQIWESGFNLILFIIILHLYINKQKVNCSRGKNLLMIYFEFYSVWRFGIEFLRDDTIRGVYGGVSFSQIVSMIIIMIILTNFIIGRRKRR